MDDHIAYATVGTTKVGVLYVPCDARAKDIVSHIAFDCAKADVVLSFNRVLDCGDGVQAMVHPEREVNRDDIESAMSSLREMQLIPYVERAYSRSLHGKPELN